MSDQEDKPPGGEAGSGDKVSVSPDQDADSDIPQLEEAMSNVDRLKQTDQRLDLRDRQEDVSEISSIDASLVDSLPRRAGSPVDSVASGRADSLQVNKDHGLNSLSHSSSIPD